MNCKNCGAPLILADGLNVWRCQYCETAKFSGELEQTEEGIAPLNESADVDCPSCNIEMQRGLIDGTPVAFCDSCHGLLIHSPSMASVVQKKRQAYTGPDDSPIMLDQAALQIKRKCPICENQFETYPYYGPGNCVIDSCQSCQVVWLDKGELSQIIRAPGIRNIDAIPVNQPIQIPRSNIPQSGSFFTMDLGDNGSIIDFTSALTDFFGD
jgi:Zn-finger nucleic acid-binding protein